MEFSESQLTQNAHKQLEKLCIERPGLASRFLKIKHSLYGSESMPVFKFECDEGLKYLVEHGFLEIEACHFRRHIPKIELKVTKLYKNL